MAIFLKLTYTCNGIQDRVQIHFLNGKIRFLKFVSKNIEFWSEKNLKQNIVFALLAMKTQLTEFTKTLSIRACVCQVRQKWQNIKKQHSDV